MNDLVSATVQDWEFRIRKPKESIAKGVLVAIHGRTGSENSMEIFTQKLNTNFWVISPRAPFSAQGSGFSWVEEEQSSRQDFSRLEQSSLGLAQRLRQILQENQIEELPLHLLGFSQGAAIALILSLMGPGTGRKVGLLSGFLPSGLLAKTGLLVDARYFIAHGRQDETVSIEQGRKLVQFLEDCGAWVDYCEADTGHKLSLPCFKAMEKFFIGNE
jgi:phospholipase/carboxylesterase